MAVTDTVRPTSTRFSGDASAVPSGTLHGVTSDNSDATYILYDEVESPETWNLRVGSHTPPANHQRHRVRGRIRARTDAGTLTDDIDLGRGGLAYIAYDTVVISSAFAELVGSWHQDPGYGLATSGALADLNIGGGWLANVVGATENRTAECYVDIDCRARPDYTAEVRDNAGVDQSGGTVTDTNQPVMHFGGVGYDGLPALNWSVTVTSGSTTVFSSSGSGQPPSDVLVTTGLDDGSYTAVFVVRSTIRASDPFEHSQTLSFSIANIVPPPSPPLVTVEPEFGGYRISWVNPGGQEWDDNYVVAEVWRDDCNGSWRIATVPDGINGSYLDLAIPQLDPQPVPGPDCEVSSEPCDITYRVRYWGYVSTSVELPENLPSDMILAWPGTAASIPSGWTRVTTLDTFYPRGTSFTSAPVATGGATTHFHTTLDHVHEIPPHNHTVGGSIGSSNTSTLSMRFNGAAYAQADQPHSHTRPGSTGSSGPYNLGGNDPGTTVVSNLPPTREVIWISSDGSQTDYPVGILGWSVESVSGWESDANSAGRFLKGAAAAANGGTNTGSATHTHTVTGHSHAGVNHDHSLGFSSLSNPSSSEEAGPSGSPARWVPRHIHPLNVSSDTTTSTDVVSGGVTSAVNQDPPHRRLRVLRNTAGGTQTRIIGLYTGAVADLDPLLTLCNGSNGTPDMRTYFARDAGSDSVNSLGGSATHTHTTPTHTHNLGGHDHAINVEPTITGSLNGAIAGDTGPSPTPEHDHASGPTATASPDVQPSTSGDALSASNIPPYREVHFVRLDGTISGDPLPVPELKVSDFSSTTVPSFTHSDGMDRLSSLTAQMAVLTNRNHDFPRLVADTTPLDGGLHTVSTTVPGQDVALTIAVEGKPDIDALEALLSSDRLYYSPLGGTSGWFAPGGWTVAAPAPTVKVVQISMVYQDWPETPEPQEYL